eukprot:gene13765-15834_t
MNFGKGLGTLVGVSVLAFLLILTVAWNQFSTANGFQLRRNLSQRHVSVKPTYLFIVGVEGVGHHGVSPAIASIAQSCQQHVIYEHQILRTMLTHMNAVKFSNALGMLARFMSPKKVLFVEGSSFPTDQVHRYAPDDTKREFGLYNINWLYDQAKIVNMDIKFLHLTRDFYRTVASHPEFDGTFEKHAEVLHDYLWYIDTEYRSIKAKESGLWRQIKYEWFTEMDNCTALAAAIVDFMGWSECNLSQACAILREDLRPPTPRTVNETEYAFAQTFNVSVSTPLLDISSTRTYSFANNAHLSTPAVDKKVDSRQRWKTDTTLVAPKMVGTAHKRVPQNVTNAKHAAVSSHTTTSSRPLTREKFVHQKVVTRSAKRQPTL